MRPVILGILGFVVVNVLLLSHSEASTAAGSDTTMSQELELAGQVGGEMTAVAVQSGYAYVAAGPWMQIYDVFEPTNPVLASETEAYEAAFYEVTVADAYAYLGQEGNVFRVLDVTDPYVPVEIGNVILHSPHGGSHDSGYISQIEIQGQYAYVVVNQPNFFGYDSSLHILDISDPTHPYEVSNYVTYLFGLYHLTVLGTELYIANGAHIERLDISNPASPTLITQQDFITGTQIKDSVIAGGYVYLISDTQFYIFDLNDPQNPIGHYMRGGQHIFANNNQAYLFGKYYPGLIDIGFNIFDITNKSNPQLIGTDQMLRAQDVDVANGYAFVAADGLYVYALANLSNPIESSIFDANTNINGIYVSNNIAYISTGSGMHILDVSPISQPTLLASSNECSAPNIGVDSTFVQNNIAYMGGDGSLCILDVSQPTMPHLLGMYEFSTITFTESRVNLISKRGNFLYVLLQEESCSYTCEYYGTLRVLDISNPAIPVETMVYDEPAGKAVSVIIADDYAYLNVGNSLRVLSLANPAVPAEVASMPVPAYISHLAIEGNRGYISTGDVRILIINLQNPLQPVVINIIDNMGSIWDMKVRNNVLYVMDFQKLQAIDVTVPESPVVIGQYEFDLYLGKLHITNDYVFLSINNNTVIAVDLPLSSATPAIAMTDPVVWGANGMIGQDNYLYVSYANQVQVLLAQQGLGPTKVGEYVTDRGTMLSLAENYLFVRSTFLNIVDISQPTQPTLVDVIATYVRYATAHDQYIYLTNYDLAIWDYSDPTNPVEVGHYEPTDFYWSPDFVTVIDHYAYIDAEIEYQRHLVVVDVANPAAPSFVSSLPLTLDVLNHITDFVVVDDIAYVTLSYSMLLVLDVADPATPQLLTSYNLGEYSPRGIEILGNIAYIAMESNGVQLLDISEPSSIEPMGLFELPQTTRLALVEDSLYVSLQESGLSWLRPSTETITTTATHFTSPSGDVAFQFGNGNTDTIQYQRWWQDEAVGDLLGMGMRFEVTAVNTNKLQQTDPYTITISYDADELGAVREETLALYHRDGSQWVRETSSVLDENSQTVSATPDQMGQFALLGETYQAYLSAVPHGYNQQEYRLAFNLDQGDNNFVDGSGYGNNGRCWSTSCPTLVAGIHQKGRRFDGVNDFIQINNAQTLNMQGAVTIAAWVKPETSSGLQNIVAHGYSLAPQGEVFLRIANGRYEVGSWDGSDHKTGFAMPAGDIGQWVHLVGVYDGTAWRLYRNGVAVSSAVDGTGAVSVHGRWAVGATGEGNGRFFQGSLDEVVVYEHGLTAVDVAQLYQRYLGQ